MQNSHDKLFQQLESIATVGKEYTYLLYLRSQDEYRCITSRVFNIASKRKKISTKWMGIVTEYLEQLDTGQVESKTQNTGHNVTISQVTIS